MILQLKTGRLQSDYFHGKFGVNILDDFAPGFRELARQGNISLSNGNAELTREGLLQVDRLLPAFFEPEYRGGRYT